jgi:uncharacterized protein YoxC
MFTIQQIQEIARKLSSMCKKDSDFKPISFWKSLSKKDSIAFVKDGENRSMTLDQLYTFVRQNINSDIGDALQRIAALEEKANKIEQDIQAINNTINSLISTINYKFASIDKNLEDINTALSILTTKYTLTVNPVTPDATVTINGIVQTSMQVTNGSIVNVKVSADGYKTYEEFILVDKDMVITPELQKEEVTFSITTIPTDCVVKLNGVARNSINIIKGSSVNWEVSKSGYITKSGSTIVTENTSMQVSLDVVGEDKINFTINVISPLDAVVTINGETTNSIIVDKNSEVTWSVEASHYESKNGTQTVTEDTTVDVTLVANKYTLTINPTPADAVVELNGEVKNSITADYNTDISIKISKKGYKTYTEKYKLIQTETKDIVLEVEEFVDINPDYMEFSSIGESKNLQIESNISWNID